MKFSSIDIHAHTNFAVFKDDYRETIKRAHDAGVAVINVGTKLETSQRTVEIAEEIGDGVYSIVGLHPIHTDVSYHDEKEIGTGSAPFKSKGEVFDLDAYRKLCENPKVVGIGECGLDYYRLTTESKQKQIEAFEAQLTLAQQIKKPVMLHIREAYRDALEILKKFPDVKGDVHFFAGTWEDAKGFLDIGFTLSFTGVITFARNYDEVIKNAPLDMIMTETDCPYVTPVPYRGKRNEPAYVVEVVKKIAQIRNESLEHVQKTLLSNAKRLFDLSI